MKTWRLFSLYNKEDLKKTTTSAQYSMVMYGHKWNMSLLIIWLQTSAGLILCDYDILYRIILTA